MAKENFLTIVWNNIPSLGLGLPTLIYVIVAFRAQYGWCNVVYGLSIIGALYRRMEQKSDPFARFPL